MCSFKFSMILADTVRSKAYILELLQNGFSPNFCVLLINIGSKVYPGQASLNRSTLNLDEISPVDQALIGNWINQDLTCELSEILEEHQINYVQCFTNTVNDEQVRRVIKKRDDKLYIFSGYGGDIIRNRILSLGVNFLHVHGGYLPTYKGSTTNYYSLLQRGTLGASAIMLSDHLDSGPIVFKREFNCPDNVALLDYFIDPGIRAKVLVEALRKIDKLQEDNLWETQNSEEGETYFVIHPILKHLAIEKRFD